MKKYHHSNTVEPGGFLGRRDFLKLLLGGTVSGAALGLPGLTPGPGKKDKHVYDVIIIGGGMSGLTAAYLMKGHNILLLEQEPALGGRILTAEWEGLRYSMGASYMGEPDKEMKSFFREIGVKPVPVPPPTDALAYKGKIYPGDYFEEALGSLEEIRDYVRVSKELYKLSAGGIEEAVYNADIDRLAKHKELDQYSVKHWLVRRKAGPVVQRYIDVENRGLFGAGNSDISFLFDIPEMGFNLYAGESAPKQFKPRPVPDFHTYRPGGGESTLWTFRHGMIEMVWAIEQAKELRGKIRGGANVERVIVNSDRTVSVTYRQEGKTHQVHAYAVVLTTPAAVTASIVKSGFSAKVMEALRAVPYTTYVTMAIFLSQRLFRNAWNIACLDTCFTTLNDAIRTLVPLDYNGKAVLGAAMPPKRANDRSLIGMSDDALFELALKDIERYFPGTKSKVLGKNIHRFRYAFPVFCPNYGEILWELHKDKTTKGPLFLAGDYMVYPTLGGASVSGWRAYELVKQYADTL